MPSDDMPALTPMRVLLLEDNPLDAELVTFMLGESGDERFELVRFQRLADARGYLETSEAGCALTDLSVLDADGLDVVAGLRDIAPDLPIVVLSGGTDEELALRAVQEGAQDYLMKGQVTGALVRRAVSYAVERKRTEIELAHRGLHDPLTGLGNRALLLDRVTHALSHRDARCALLFLDLDSFKQINDRFGHEVGDRVLVEVAARLAETVRPADTVARLGGDEFVVLCEGVTTEEALGVATRVRRAIGASLTLDAGEMAVSASLGLTLAHAGDETAALLGEADRAMYDAKRSGAGIALAPAG